MYLYTKYVKDIKEYYAYSVEHLEAKAVVVLLIWEVLEDMEELIAEVKYVVWYKANAVTNK